MRDLALGRPLTDVDLATDMPLEELASLFKTHAVGRSGRFDTVVIGRGGHASKFPASGAAGRSGRPAGRTPGAPRPAARRHRAPGLHDQRAAPGADGASSTSRAASPTCEIASSAASAPRRSASPRTRRAPCAPCASPRASASRSKRDRRGDRRGRAAAGGRRGRADRQGDPQNGLATGRGARRRRHAHGSLRAARVAPARSRGSPGTAAADRVAPRGGRLGTHARRAAIVDVGRPGGQPGGAAARCRQAPGAPGVAGRHHYRGHESAGRAGRAVARRLFLPQRLRAAITFAVGHHVQAGRFAELRRSTSSCSSPATGRSPGARAVRIAARGDAAAVARLDAEFREAEAEAAADRGRAGAPVISGTRIMELTGLAPGPARRRDSAPRQRVGAGQPYRGSGADRGGGGAVGAGRAGRSDCADRLKTNPDGPPPPAAKARRLISRRAVDVRRGDCYFFDRRRRGRCRRAGAAAAGLANAKLFRSCGWLWQVRQLGNFFRMPAGC